MENTQAIDSAAMTAAQRLPLLEAENAKLRQLVADLQHNVEVFRKLAFGPSSEKRRGSDPDITGPVAQGLLFFADLVAEAHETAERHGIDTSIEARAPKKPRKLGGRRKKFPDHVPQVTTRYELPETDRVCCCGNELHEIGCETARELERSTEPGTYRTTPEPNGTGTRDRLAPRSSSSASSGVSVGLQFRSASRSRVHLDGYSGTACST